MLKSPSGALLAVFCVGFVEFLPVAVNGDNHNECKISSFGPFHSDFILLMCSVSDSTLGASGSYSWYYTNITHPEAKQIDRSITVENYGSSFLKVSLFSYNPGNYNCVYIGDKVAKSSCNFSLPKECVISYNMGHCSLKEGRLPNGIKNISQQVNNGTILLKKGINQVLMFLNDSSFQNVTFIPASCTPLVAFPNKISSTSMNSESTVGTLSNSSSFDISSEEGMNQDEPNSGGSQTIEKNASQDMKNSGSKSSSVSSNATSDVISPKVIDVNQTETKINEKSTTTTKAPTPTTAPSRTTTSQPTTKSQISITQITTRQQELSSGTTQKMTTTTTASEECNSAFPSNCAFEFHKNLTYAYFKILFHDFSQECEGVYKLTTTAGWSVAIQTQLDNYNDIPPDDDHKDYGEDKIKISLTGVIVSVVFLVIAAVVIVSVIYIRRRRWFSRHPRFPIRNKMVSTISGSKVQFIINKSDCKEAMSELEEFPRKHIRFLDTIGKGTFGTVVMAEALNLLNKKKGPISRNWAVVAVKMTLISEKYNEELKKDFLSELALMKTIPPHVNIITLHASCTAHDPYLMILEYAEHGDLRKFLLEHRMERNYANAAFSAYGVGNRKEVPCSPDGCGNKKDKFESNIYAVPGEQRYTNFPTNDPNVITSRDLLSFALQICRGLEHLTRNKIVHRDVAARNILLFKHNIVKISDFGLARKVGQADVYERTRKGLLPIRWMSPESLFYNKFTEKSDVWSYGVLLWELITLGSTPYPGLDAATVLEKIRERELLVCPQHSATVVNNIVVSCWKEDSQSRPTFCFLCRELEELLEAEVEYVDLDQMNDHEYSTLDCFES